jgi:hypothetical protein
MPNRDDCYSPTDDGTANDTSFWPDAFILNRVNDRQCANASNVA